jgi:hypothetical protein
MRKLKIAFLSLVVILTSFTSCSDNESVDIPQNGTESTSMRTAVNKLRTKLDENGNIDASRNPTGNMVFDYGLSFQFPITLVYNTGATVTVNSFEELIQVVVGVTDDLYINGVEFPITVEIYNDETGAIEVVTINSEEELADLLDDIDFEDDDCECTEEYSPVCVEVMDENDVAFVLTFPNACYAMCEGFEQADFLDSCEEDYDDDYENDCFEFNFPLDITTDEGETITVDSMEDLGNLTYDMNYFEFVFPLTVTNEDGETEEIEDEEDLFELYEDCYDDYDDDCEIEVAEAEEALMFCDAVEAEIYELDGDVIDVNSIAFNANNELVVNGEPTVTDLGSWSLSDSDEGMILTIGQLQTFTMLNGDWELVECDDDSLEFENGEYALHIEIECEDDDDDDDCDCPDEYVPVCAETEDGIEEFDNMCELICEGYTQADIVDCEDDDDDDDEDECEEEDYVEALVSCGWLSYGDQNEMTEYLFNPAGVVTITDNDGNTYTGTWTITMPEDGDVYVSFTVDGVDVDTTWYFLTCDEDTEVYTNSNTYVERDCE